MVQAFGTRLWNPKVTGVTVGQFHPGLPFIRIAGGQRILVYLPGLSDAFMSPLDHPEAYTKVFPGIRASHTTYFIGRASDRSPGIGITSLTDDIAQAIKAIIARENLTEPCVDIAGSAFGGICALAVAARHHEFTRRVSINSAAHRLAPKGKEIILHWLDLATNRQWIALSDSMASVSFTGYRKVWVKILSKFLLPLGGGIPQYPEKLIQALTASLSIDLSGEIEKIDVPVQIIGGAGDLLYPPDILEEAADLIPYSDLAIFKNASHGIAIEKRKRYERELADFICEI